MLIRRCAPLLAAASVGFCAGCAFDERVKRSLAVFAHAGNVAVLNSSLPTATSDKLVGTGESRSSQIMRYGFPGYDNLRTFEDFVLSYDRRHRWCYRPYSHTHGCRTVHWVLEHITPDRLEYAPSVDRSKCAFIEDTSIHEYFRARNGDYKASGYDRGHMAAAGNHRRSQTAIEQTFTLSNMAPQVCSAAVSPIIPIQVGKGFNRDKWNELEKHVRSRAHKCRNMFVCTGPLYLARPDARDGQMYVRYRVIGATQVAVPTHFFKGTLKPQV
jgi:endonuclease G